MAGLDAKHPVRPKPISPPTGWQGNVKNPSLASAAPARRWSRNSRAPRFMLWRWFWDGERMRGAVTDLAKRYTAITLRTGTETLIPNEVLAWVQSVAATVSLNRSAGVPRVSTSPETHKNSDRGRPRGTNARELSETIDKRAHRELSDRLSIEGGRPGAVSPVSQAMTLDTSRTR